MIIEKEEQIEVIANQMFKDLKKNGFTQISKENIIKELPYILKKLGVAKIDNIS